MKMILRLNAFAAMLALLFHPVSRTSASDPALEPMFRPGTTVVLLVGMAGDNETEKNYRDQMNAWLDLLRDQPSLKAVFLLSDLEAEKDGLLLSRRKATREEFLKVAAKLPSDSKQLVVIGWGHGGMQGSTPVFHVRGQRLVADDFKVLAEAAKGRSQWLLFFRGSGRFAAQLAAPGREIISSERDTIFSNDPIGLPLLLKRLLRPPQPGFQELAGQLGRATQEWYQHRHLVRTEEPTLWIANEPPKVLVQPDDPATNEVDANPPAASTPAAPLKNALASTTNLPPIWKTIQKVDAQKYPDADAVVLRKRRVYTLGTQPALSTEHEEFIQVLTLEGKHFGDFDFSYSPPEEDMVFLACEVLKPGGELLRLDPDEIRDAIDDQMPDYGITRRKFFSLPGVGPGAVLRVHYRSSWRRFPLPHVCMQVPLSDDSPIARQTVEISIPRSLAFHFGFKDITARDPELKQTEYGTTYKWTFADVPPRCREALIAPDSEVTLSFSTFPDWASFGQWYAGVIRLVDDVTPEISATAVEVTREATTDREKIIALYNYVTGLRYVAVEMGVNSFRPHAAANVLRNQFGDCKDKANLFNTLLHSLQLTNVSAHLVLVPRFAQADNAIPGLAFNHAISRVICGSETLFLDTTDDACRFGMLPPGDDGRRVFIVDGKSAGLTQLPAALARDHALNLTGKVHCVGPSDWPVSFDVSTRGYPDYEFRTAAQQAKSRKTNVPLLAARHRLAGGVFKLQRQTSSSPAALAEQFHWSGEGTLAGVSTETAESGMMVRSPFWIPFEWDSALHRRSSSMFLNHGYPLQLNETIEFELPRKPSRVIIPPLQEAADGPLRWRIQWEHDDETVKARFTAELPEGEIKATDVPAFQKQLGKFFHALASGARVEF